MKKLNWFDNVEDRNHPWPGLTWLTTALITPDVRQALDFYTGPMEMVSIAELEGDDGELLFARVRYRGINFTINKEGWYSDCISPLTSGQTPPIILYMYVDDVCMVAEKMEKEGAWILVKPDKQFWGDLKARIKDPFGYIWDIAQPL